MRRYITPLPSIPFRALLLAAVGLGLAGCTTPPEVRTALANKDKAYAESIQLMDSMHKIAKINEARLRSEFIEINTQLLLWLALETAITKKAPTNEIGQALLDAALALKVEPGSIHELFKQMPKWVRLARTRAAERWDETQKFAAADAAFIDYANSVRALQSINSTVSSYLNIDITATPADLKEIADAIKELSQ